MDLDDKKLTNDHSALELMADNFRGIHSKEISVPNPSSVKDLLADSKILANVKRRLQDEAEDT